MWDIRFFSEDCPAETSGIKAMKDAAVSSRVLLFHGVKAVSRRAHRTSNSNFGF